LYETEGTELCKLTGVVCQACAGMLLILFAVFVDLLLVLEHTILCFHSFFSHTMVIKIAKKASFNSFF